MAILLPGPEFVIDICKALGLKNVTKLKIEMNVGEVVTVEASFYPDRQSLESVFAKYDLAATRRTEETKD